MCIWKYSGSHVHHPLTVKMVSMMISSTSATKGSRTSVSVICRLDHSTEEITMASPGWTVGPQGQFETSQAWLVMGVLMDLPSKNGKALPYLHTFLGQIPSFWWWQGGQLRSAINLLENPREWLMVGLWWFAVHRFMRIPNILCSITVWTT